MTRVLGRLAAVLGAVLLFLLLSGMPHVADASLIGDSVTCAVSSGFPDFPLACPPATALVADPGSEFVPGFNGFGGFVPVHQIDIEASSITLTSINSRSFASTQYTLGDLDSSAGDIVGVGLSTSGPSTGLALSAVSFTAHSVTIDLAQTNWTIDTSGAPVAVISLLFEDSAAVPAPATLILVAAAIVGIGTVRARRRR